MLFLRPVMAGTGNWGWVFARPVMAGAGVNGLTVKKAVFTHSGIEELDHKVKEKLPSLLFDVAFLPNVF